jgi:acetyl-CoA carboxylase alpha subunit
LNHENRVQSFEQELKRLEKEKNSIEQQEEMTLNQSKKKTFVDSNVMITNLSQAALAKDASAYDILSAMKEILVSRSRERPYNGLKKALVAVAESPGKVSRQ